MLVWAQGKCNICRGSKFIHLVIIEEDRCKNIKQFCSARVSCFFVFFLHPSLCKVLKLTFARDIRRLPQDDFIKSEMSYGSMRQVISVLTPWHIHLSCTTLVSFRHGSLVSTFKWPRVEVSQKSLDSLSSLKCHAVYICCILISISRHIAGWENPDRAYVENLGIISESFSPGNPV